MSQSVLIQKSLKFSAKIIKLQQYLIKEKKETIDMENNKVEFLINMINDMDIKDKLKLANGANRTK